MIVLSDQISYKFASKGRRNRSESKEALFLFRLECGLFVEKNASTTMDNMLSIKKSSIVKTFSVYLEDLKLFFFFKV